MDIRELTMADPNEVLREALALRPAQKAELIDKLILSLDKPDKDIDELWAKEAESRIEAYEQGKIKAVTLEEVLKKYRSSQQM
jgi:putative addiction module component (TIGR02574 family)